MKKLKPNRLNHLSHGEEFPTKAQKQANREFEKGIAMKTIEPSSAVMRIIKAAKELEKYLSLYEKDFDELERIIHNKDEWMEGCVDAAIGELNIRTQLKEAIEDFEHDHIFI